MGADGSYGYKRIDEISQVVIQGRNTYALIYNQINAMATLSNLKMKLSEPEVI